MNFVFELNRRDEKSVVKLINTFKSFIQTKAIQILKNRKLMFPSRRKKRTHHFHLKLITITLIQYIIEKFIGRIDWHVVRFSFLFYFFVRLLFSLFF